MKKEVRDAWYVLRHSEPLRSPSAGILNAHGDLLPDGG